MDLPGYVCPWDATAAHPGELLWRCPRCGSPWDLDFTPGPPPRAAGASGPASLWRYGDALPLQDPAISLGEGGTPLVQLTGNVRAKLDFLMPTLSFKDRGSAPLLELARRLDPARVIADSSGNAGASIAAYASRAGLPCTVYVPDGAAAAAAVARISATGADVVAAGDREHAALLARAAADLPGSFYASHVFNPYFLHGTKTYGYELWEGLGGRLPEALVLPVGNGTLLLGVALAVDELLGHGLIDRRPVLLGVQAAAVAPLATAFRAGAADLTHAVAHRRTHRRHRDSDPAAAAVPADPGRCPRQWRRHPHRRRRRDHRRPRRPRPARPAGRTDRRRLLGRGPPGPGSDGHRPGAPALRRGPLSGRRPRRACVVGWRIPPPPARSLARSGRSTTMSSRHLAPTTEKGRCAHRMRKELLDPARLLDQPAREAPRRPRAPRSAEQPISSSGRTCRLWPARQAPVTRRGGRTARSGRICRAAWCLQHG